jgi:heat shock protein 4
LISDATRTPIIQEIIKQVFEKHELQRTLNALETIGRGASLQAAMLSPHFNVSKFIMEEWNSFPVTIDYKFNGEEKGHTMEIIKKKSNFPVT